MTTTRLANICVSAAIIGLSVWVMVEASQFPESSSPDTVGPGRLPMIVAALLCLSGIALLIRAVRGIGSDESFSLAEAKIPAAILAACVVFVFGMKYVGFPIAGLIWFFVSAFFLGRDWKTSLASAVILVGFIYVVFHIVLSVPLP